LTLLQVARYNNHMNITANNNEAGVGTISRRQFMRRCGQVAVASGLLVAAANVLVACGEDPKPIWQPIGKLTDFAVGKVTTVKLKLGGSGREIPVFVQLVSQQPQVLGGVCTHAGALVGWDESKQQFVCPQHGSVFNKSGHPLTGPAAEGNTGDLPTLQLKVENGIISVFS